MRTMPNTGGNQRPSGRLPLTQGSQVTTNVQIECGLSRPGPHRQAPIRSLQDMRNAASMGKVEVDRKIAQEIRGKGKSRANLITSAGMFYGSLRSSLAHYTCYTDHVYSNAKLLKLNVKSSPKFPQASCEVFKCTMATTTCQCTH